MHLTGCPLPLWGILQMFTNLKWKQLKDPVSACPGWTPPLGPERCNFFPALAPARSRGCCGVAPHVPAVQLAGGRRSILLAVGECLRS